jgi:hypothetical protein
MTDICDSSRALATLIRNQGIIQPLVTRPEDGYELIAGERRWRDALLRNKAAAGSVAQRQDGNPFRKISTKYS